ncbi:MAG: hypothetical protein ACXV4A_09385 [Actinomycetes bacterium]
MSDHEDKVAPISEDRGRWRWVPLDEDDRARVTRYIKPGILAALVVWRATPILGTLALGTVVSLYWSWRTRSEPVGPQDDAPAAAARAPEAGA